MAGADQVAVTAGQGAVSSPLVDRLIDVLTSSPVSSASVSMLLFSLLTAVIFLATRGGRSWRRARPWRVLKLLLSRKYLLHRTHMLDALYFIFNTRALGFAIGLFLISGPWVSFWCYNSLVATFGARTPTTLSPWIVWVLGTIIVWITYEFGYWLHHYLFHRVPFLWEFHKVHHQAEMLSPATNFRVHPVDTLVFSNILSLTIGPMDGLLCFAFGAPYKEVSMFGFHFMLVVVAYLVVQLQHTHVWIPFTGIWGKLFVSPAHHQIHHSTNPIHFNRNMGSILAIFDWLFGTLHVPQKKREKLTFGADSTAADPHTLVEGLINPFVRAWGHIQRWLDARKQTGSSSHGPKGGHPPLAPTATGTA